MIPHTRMRLQVFFLINNILQRVINIMIIKLEASFDQPGWNHSLTTCYNGVSTAIKQSEEYFWQH